MFSKAIKDLCSRNSLALLAFLTGPVEAGSFAARSVLFGDLALLVTRVLDMLLHHVLPLVVKVVGLPDMMSGYVFGIVKLEVL